MLSDCRTHSNSLIRLTDGHEDIVKSLPASHYDDFVDGVNRYGMDYAELAIEHGEQFVNVISTHSQYSCDIIKYISNDGMTAIDIIDKFGENGIEYADISSEKMFKILATNKGLKAQDQMCQHIYQVII